MRPGKLRRLGRALASVLPLAALAAVLVAGCTAGRLALPGDLRVGLHTDYPPLAFEKDGRVVGIEPDLATLVGREIDRRVRLVPLERSDLIPALERGDIDVIMSGMSVTPERSRRVRFIEPYVRVGQMAILRRDRVADLGRPGDLQRPGVRVGVVAGTTGESYATDRLPRAQKRAFESIVLAEDALRAGRIDYLIHDAPTAWRLGMDLRDGELIGLYRPLTEEWLAWAVRPDDAELARRLDALADRWRADGTVDRVLNAWVPVRIIQ
jgi:polar amino acid transport system substrate-binding protein